jgi:hypothetical protein
MQSGRPENDIMTALVGGFVALLVLGTGYVLGFGFHQSQSGNVSVSQKAQAVSALLTREFQKAHSVRIGNGSPSGFQEIPAGTLQRGNALIATFGPEGKEKIIYYQDAVSASLKRDGTCCAEPELLMPTSSKGVMFCLEDLRGNVVRKKQDARLVAFQIHYTGPKQVVQFQADPFKGERMVRGRARPAGVE